MLSAIDSGPDTAKENFPDPAHLRLIRNLHLIWSPVEGGSPWINCVEPLGQMPEGGEARQLAAEITGLPLEEAERKLIETAINIHTFVEHALLQPGVYQIPEHFGGPCQDEDFGLAANGDFTFRPEHLTLLRHMRWRWPVPQEVPELLAAGIYPFPLTESKRPYGDYTWYECEMAEILEEPYATDADGKPVRDAEKDKRMRGLHYETLPALQVLFLYGEMP